MVDAAKRASAGRITAVMPFFGYARQDRKDKPRVPITAKLVANLISAAGVDRVLTMDLHAAQIQGFFDIPVDHLYAKPVFIKHLREQHGDDASNLTVVSVDRVLTMDLHAAQIQGFFDIPVDHLYAKPVFIKHLREQHGDDASNLTVVSPDVGGVKMARSYADKLGAELAIVAKHRVSATKVEAMNVIGDVDGRNVLLVDDMTETAGTLCAAAEILEKHGAKSIYAGVSHGVLGDMGRKRIADSAIKELITSDSVPQAYGEKVTTVSIAGLMGDAISRIHDGKSVTSLFDIDA